MSDETPRLRLAQLVSLQELNAVTWNEALAQLDALVDLVLLGQYANTPPSNPADGDAYLIGGAPTGAWSGYAYKIAACLDGAWRFYIPFNGLRAFLPASGTFIVYCNGVWTDCNALISANEQALASAATCDLGSANALFVQITGTTSITSFGTGTNKLRFVRFAQSLTLTHTATSLVLLGGVSRVTAAGDVGLYASDASGNWRERSYCRASVNPVDGATKSGSETLSNKTLTATLLPGGAITAAGYLGLGTTNPARLIEANGGTATDRVLRLTSASPYGALIEFYAAGSGGRNYEFGSTAASATQGPGVFFIRDASSAADRMVIDAAGHWLAGADNTQNLGSSGRRFATLYAATGAINTSGMDAKTNIAALSEREITVAKLLAAKLRVYQFCDAVAKKGVQRARLHLGMLYDDVVACFAARGLDPFRYGIVCRDRDESDPQKWIVGLRYDELAQFVMAGLCARLEALEARLSV